MLHYQVASDLPDGATSNSEMSELGYNRHVHYTLALMCAKICIIIFCSLLDIGKMYCWIFAKMSSGLVFIGPPCMLR